MGKINANTTIESKKIKRDRENRINEIQPSCPYEEKKCFDCMIQECPEEGE